MFGKSGQIELEKKGNINSPGISNIISQKFPFKKHCQKEQASLSEFNIQKVDLRTSGETKKNWITTTQGECIKDYKGTTKVLMT